MESTYTSKFEAYFQRAVAQNAAKSLSDGAEIEFQIPSLETFTFTKNNGKNVILSGPAKSPQLVFIVPQPSADLILSHPSEHIPEIGVHLVKLILSPDPQHKVELRIKSGLMSLLTKGYFGIITAGGTEFASFLASRGFNGLGAIKEAIKRLKK